MNYEYDIAISFAGENRPYAAELANNLRESGVKVFFDEFEVDILWGKNLYTYLSDIYSKQAQYCVMLLSKDYAKKAWTNHERESAQERAFKENEEYILPIKIDDTEIPGILSTVGYLDSRQKSINEIVDLILRKLGKSKPDKAEIEDEEDAGIIIPKMKKNYTEYDKDRFLENSFQEIFSLFERSAKSLNNKYDEVNIDVEPITKYKFVARLYLRGEKINECKIWIGGIISSNSINYSEGRTVDIHSDNSMNDSLSVQVAEGNLFLKPLGTAFFSNIKIPENATPKEAAQYYWQRFTQRLSQ